MKVEEVAGLAALPEAARRNFLDTMTRMSAIELATHVHAPGDTNDQIIVRARQFENYMKRG